MALKPEGRYISPRMLAEEIERWMADEPVTAFPEGPARRLARWSRRNRAWVGRGWRPCAGRGRLQRAALAIDQARRNERTALGSATRALTAEQVALDGGAGRQRPGAGEPADGRGQFPDRPRRGRPLLHAGQRGHPPERAATWSSCARTCSCNSREYYQKFVAERKDDPNAQADLGAAYLRLSNIDSAIGSTRDAIDHAEPGRSCSENSSQVSPNSPEFADNLARCDTAFGSRLRKDRPGHGRGGVSHTREGRLKGLADAAPRVHPYHAGTRTHLRHLGILHKNTGRATIAEWCVPAASWRFNGGWATRTPRTPNYRTALAYTHNNLGVVFRLTGRSKDSEDSYRERALDAWRRLSERTPEVTLYQHELSGCLYNLSNLYLGPAGPPTRRRRTCGRTASERGWPRHPPRPPSTEATWGGPTTTWASSTRTPAGRRRRRRHTDMRWRSADRARRRTPRRRQIPGRLGTLAQQPGRPLQGHRAGGRGGDVVQARAGGPARAGRRPPRDPDYRLELAKSCGNLGVLLSRDRPRERTRARGTAGRWRSRRSWSPSPLRSSSPRSNSVAPASTLWGALPTRGPPRGEPRLVLPRDRDVGGGAEARAPAPGRPATPPRRLRGCAEALGRLGRHAEAVADWDRAVDRGDEKTRDDLRLGRARARAVGRPSGRRRRDGGDGRGRIDPGRPSRLRPGVRLEPRVGCGPGRRVDGASRVERAGRTTLGRRRDPSAGGGPRLADFFGGPAGLNRIEDDPDLDPLRARGDFQLLRMDLAFPNDPFALAG